ncbi:MAG: DUF2267 domain-containing protein [Hymenobacteraceae bacterium]|nr:DUF2267 domain-containing protein [Hymenobacteraceae bacterium]
MGFSNFDERSKAFLDGVATELNAPDDLGHAFRVTQSVFYTLRDTIAMEDSRALVGRLPDDITAMYEDDWDTAKERTSYETSEDFYNAVRDNSLSVAEDLYSNTEVRQAVQAVFKVLKEPATESMWQRITDQLPESLRSNL